MPPKSTTFKNFLRGVVPVAGVKSQPKGSVARGSNLLLSRRGSLITSDGTQLLHAFSGAVQSGRGRIMASFLFSPTGVGRYYLILAKAFDQHLGPPHNVAATIVSGGSLPSGTEQYYIVTALDGAGGETNGSAAVTATPSGSNLSVNLTWNTVPNAVAYNVYRSTAVFGETLLVGSATAVLPVPQPSQGTLSVSFTDDGTTSAAPTSATVINAVVFSSPSGGTYVEFQLSSPLYLPSTVGLSYSGGATGFNGSYTQFSFPLSSQTQSGLYIDANGGPASVGAVSLGGTLSVAGSALPPATDTTQQTALYKMPLIANVLPVSYNNSNIVALFPADVLPYNPSGGGGVGGGGHGSGGGGGATGGNAGNVGLLPQLVEFTNQVVIALGNGYAPQVYSDPTTATNPATTASISSISVDANGVVTITTSSAHGFPTSGVVNAGSNVLIAGVSPSVYNGAFPLLQIVSSTQIKVQNVAAIGAGAGSGGTTTTTTIPVLSTFSPQIPVWVASTPYSIGSVVQPSTSNGHYYKCIVAGTSGATQPTFGTSTGSRYYDAGVIWQESGLVESAAPPPPGCAHVQAYSGALWMLNTSPSNTSTGLDGPTSLRMSDVGNLNSWNPINQAFLDKDDGTEGMGMASFTITAQGIPPEGSLVAFKNYATYQILGLFGAPNFAIQRVKSDMGCTAPRSIQFLPGFGIGRYTHLGVAIFDGVDDRTVSEEIRPYLFPTNDVSLSDITPVDAGNVALSWGAQTAQPPLYTLLCPVGPASFGQLTRIFCYDLVLKSWAIADLPWPASTLAQFRTTVANPVTVVGGFSDGLLSRWQAGDILWDTGATGVRSPSVVSWAAKTSTLAASDEDQPVYVLRLMIRGINSNSAAALTVVLYLDGVAQPSYVSPILPTGDFEIEVPVASDLLRAEAYIYGSGDVELTGWSWGVVPKTAGVPLVLG